MADERPFDALRTLDRRLEPRPAFADELFATLVLEAGLGSSESAERRGVGREGWRQLPRRTTIFRAVLLAILLLALLAAAVLVVGSLVRERRGFVPIQVDAVDATASTGWAVETVASAGDVSGQPSIAQAGRSTVVAYLDVANARVLAATCADPTCSSLGPVVDTGPVIANVAFIHRYAAAALDGGVWIGRATMAPDGESIVELARACPEPAGTCRPTPPRALGRADSAVVAVRADGRPVVVLGSLGASTATVYSCAEPACAAGRSVDVQATPGQLDAAVTPDGRVLVATSDDDSVRLLVCADDICADAQAVTLGPGHQPRIALDSAGRPIVVALSGRSVVLYRCADPECGSGSVAVLADLGQPPTGADELDTLDVVVAAGDRPMVSYGAAGSLRLLACQSIDCATVGRIDLAASSPALAAPHAIGLDGNGRPFVAFGVRSDLQVAHCVTEACLSITESAAASSTPSRSHEPSAGPRTSAGPTAAGLTTTTIEGVQGAYSPAVAIGSDDRPVAVYAVGSDAVHVLRCGDEQCASGNTIATLPATEPAGSAIAIDGQDDPVLALATWAGSVTVVRCADRTCATRSTTSPIEGAEPEFVSVAVPDDDRPVIAYVTDGDRAIHLARCVTARCDAVSTTRVDPNPGGWSLNTLELRLAGRAAPVLAYALANGEVRFAHCDTLDCGAPRVLTVGSGALDNTTAALGVGSDGIPLVAFYSDGSLRVGRCPDASCASMPTVRVDAATAGWWSPVGVGVGPDGHPRVAYFSPTNRDTKLAICGDVTCSTADLIPLEASDANGADDATGVAFRPDGEAVFVFVRNPSVIVESCADERCGG